MRCNIIIHVSVVHLFKGYYQFNKNASSEEVICGASPIEVVFTLNLQV